MSRWIFIHFPTFRFLFILHFQGIVVENIARRCGGFLKTLSLRGCQSVVDSSLRTFAQQCNNIEDLNLNDCKKISDRYLKKLKFWIRFLVTLRKNFSTCQSLSRYCPKLQRLNLNSCSAITDLSLKDLAAGCHQLTHINISWCDQITENGKIFRSIIGILRRLRLIFLGTAQCQKKLNESCTLHLS
jgi:F-box and leucine-rich repeat protein 2/20